MSSLSKQLRNQLEKVTLAARDCAEDGARAALENLAIHEKDYREHMTVEQRQLRNRLRARGRALGDELDTSKGTQSIRHLAEHAAYEHWHRLLFTRFLTENNLLITDEENGSVPVSLQDCEELAPEKGAKDGFELACRFASKILPGVFRKDDPVLELTFALNHQVELRDLLDSIAAEVFRADDSLGWTYQFWQAKRKEEVNASGKKIGADELSPVTQLFTEDYMVEFLLHNTLGAWWAGKQLAVVDGLLAITSEAHARLAVSLPAKDGLPAVNWTYLRFVQKPQSSDELVNRKSETVNPLLPAAGTFDGWPKTAKEITFLDPCMGSGHFLVFALPILARLRMEEENFTAADAVLAVLRDNLFGLELDERCTQIAAFNVALTAWKLGGHQTLPHLHLACSGLAPNTSEKHWLELAGDNDRLKRGMARIYSLFKNAPILGSLINPRAGRGDLVEAYFHEIQPLLEKALAHEIKDDNAHELAVTAQGVAKAAEILAGNFTLVGTNVPYLGRDKQDEILKAHCERVYFEEKADLAACFIQRCLAFCCDNGTSGLVTPQSWLYQDSFKKMRPLLLADKNFDLLGRLGPGAFEGIGGEVVNVCLVSITRAKPADGHLLFGLDLSQLQSPTKKRQGLSNSKLESALQKELLKNPHSKISLDELGDRKLLSAYATCHLGICTGDYSRFGKVYWEVSTISDGVWSPEHTTVEDMCPYGGMLNVLLWDGGEGEFVEFLKDRLGETGIHQWLRGQDAWNRRGVIVSATGKLSASLYLGHLFDNNVSVILPRDSDHLPAIWTFCSSPNFHDSVRRINQGLKITDQSMVEVPFDLAHWQQVAAEKYPNGLPKPFSTDPTQWLFNGQPRDSDHPLHVAVARLLGYQWPRQTGSSFPDCPALASDGLEKFADDDGIVCLAPLRREQPGAARLRNLLVQALGQFDERKLISESGPKGSKSTNLEDWLRDEFFEQHCELFHHRPFLWHIWDGRKDGFQAIVNYHRLDHGNLQKLAYTYLGDWIRQQTEELKAEKPGAAERVGAAQALQTKLDLILKGEAPYDIFVRWKPLSKQPVGWNPDINDGVRLNIRPFAIADVLRKRVKIKWDKDRGKEPQRDKADYPWFWCAEEPDTNPQPGKEFTGYRWNNVHLTLEPKRKAQE